MKHRRSHMWRYGWYRRLMTPTYQCPECRRSYHHCKCDRPAGGSVGYGEPNREGGKS